ncbi:putative extracellular aldonolactonase [Phaeomoniella chlamydospora]|uniref:Putative extracellular aldonolactonase n=1 Tax=Phaeomoniella chlamydospora TaxID=158046 RepID=A0A0G2E0P9_PHACM|nr:putative extracellular aldonolactonase [Phaeomoniella chlamydospora]
MLREAFKLTLALATAQVASGNTLFVANYANSVTQLSLTRSGSTAKLETTGVTRDCGITPSWLELDKAGDNLFCINEAYTLEDAGSLSSFSLNSTPPVIRRNSSSDVGGVYSTIYAPNRIALAHYTGSAVSVFDTSNVSSLVEIQSFHYTLSNPGPNPSRQEAPHPHQILQDPTGQYLVAPDLGADLLRIYSVGWDDRLTELEPFQAISGSGPRHGAFLKTHGKTYYYLLGELSNSLTGYEVLYENNTLTFAQIYSKSTFSTSYGDGSGSIFPAEIYSPEPKHLTISLRNDSRSTFEDQPSDTLITYKIDPKTGNPSLLDTSPAGGSYPRAFSVNANGTLVAVTTQYSGRLTIFERDPTTGLICHDALATWTTDEENDDGYSLVHVIWEE